MFFRRMLMNAVDDTAGSGGASSGQPATPAPNAPVESSVSVEAMVAAMKIPATRDAFFAQMRREGLISGGKPKPPESTTPPAERNAPSESPPVNLRAEIQAALQRNNAFNRALLHSGVELTPAQVGRIERAFEAEQPQSPGEWVSEFIADMGLSKKAAAATQTTPTTAINPPAAPAAPVTPAPAQPPVTAVGAPAQAPPSLDAINFMTLSPEGRDELVKRIGLQEFNKRAMAQLGNVRVDMRRR